MNNKLSSFIDSTDNGFQSIISFQSDTLARDLPSGTVYRLTIRGSDEEIYSGDDEDTFQESFSGLSLKSPQVKGQTGSPKSRSPDSGFATNGHSPVQEQESRLSALQMRAPQPPSTTKPAAARKRRRRKKKVLPTVPDLHELPKQTPLPPVRTNSQVSWTSSSSDGPSRENSMVLHRDRRATGPEAGNFDDLLIYVDSTVVSNWLKEANRNVADMAQWCYQGDNFVQFAHFWLSDFPDMQRFEIFKLEYGILVDHMNLVFASGRESGKVKHRDVVTFLEAVFREYPGKMMSSKGPHLFLDYLDILSSERQESYKTLLSDVKIRTVNKEYAQWCLAVRSFTLVNVWYAVLNFYRRLAPEGSMLSNLPLPSSAKNVKSIHEQRMYQAIRNGHTDVVNYLVCTKKVASDACDSHGRTLVFTAVMHNQPAVLKYLLTKIKPPPDPTKAADTGNTPLHAAANSGDANSVSILLKVPGIQVNPVNPQCDNATPLHFAVMHGHQNVVELLLQAKADRHMKMGDLTATDIARDFGHTDILHQLEASPH